MPINKGMMSSNKTDWETPQGLFDNLDRTFCFTLDAAANHANAKCANYYTEEDDALSLPWEGSVWLNPPYGINITGKWVKKAYTEAMDGNVQSICMLLPARTDTKYFHEFVMRATEIWFIKGRLKFVGGGGVAPFPSMLVFFDGWSGVDPIPKVESCDKVGNIIH